MGRNRRQDRDVAGLDTFGGHGDECLSIRKSGLDGVHDGIATGVGTVCSQILAESPTKIWEQTVPTDPCIYRFYEIVGVYGPTLKAIIQEKFGDGIMSAIDFDMSVTRVEHPKGDRVKVEMSGKFLGYNSW